MIILGSLQNTCSEIQITQNVTEIKHRHEIKLYALYIEF